MKSSSSTERVLLFVKAENAFTEVVVVDGDLRVVATSAGDSQFELPPGLYSVRLKSGDQVEEQFVALRPGDTSKTIQGQDLLIASPAPIEATSTTHEFQSYPAVDHSKTMGGPPDEGCLYLFVRHVRRTTAWQPPDIWVFDTEGNQVADLKNPVPNDGYIDTGAAYACFKVWLKPGFYRIRQGKVKSREIGVQVCRQWQTQVFATTTKTSAGRYRADLGNASVMMARPDEGFRNDLTDNKLTETARLALRRGRALDLDLSIVNDLAWGKYRDPMLGIYGAYLILLRPNPDYSMLREMVNNLRNLLGDRHPDVELINLLVQQKERTSGAGTRDIPPFDIPPTLAEGYRLLINAQVAQQWLVPSGSFTTQISTHVTGNGLWLCWNTPKAAAQTTTTRRTKKIAVSQLQPLVFKVDQYVNQIATSAAFQSVLDTLGASEAFASEDIASTLSTSGNPDRGETLNNISSKTVARKFSVPVDVAKAALDHIKRQL